VGLGVLGLSVNYADMKAANRAVVMNSKVSTWGKTTIKTNDDGSYATTAEAQTVAAQLGLVTAGMNAAIARNHTKNYATLIGDKALDLGELEMHATGNASANAKLKRVIVSSDMINEYGFEFSDLAGVQADNLPDPASMNYNEFILDGKHYAAGSSLQTLLDNGWTLPLDMDPAAEIEGLNGIWVHGEHLDLYNGQTMAHVSVYNYSDKTAPLNECLIETVSVETEDNTVLLSAGGLQAGVSTVADAEALLGAPADTEEDYKGFVTYEFKVMDDQVTISVIDDGDGLIGELIISGVNR
jgi:hypothetical protein